MEQLEQKFLEIDDKKVVYAETHSSSIYNITVYGYSLDKGFEKLKDFKEINKVITSLRSIYPICHITFE